MNPLTVSVKGFQLVEAAGQYTRIFRRGLDYAFIAGLLRRDAGRVIRCRILVPALFRQRAYESLQGS